MPPKTPSPQEMYRAEKLRTLLDYHPAPRIVTNLRSLYMDYITDNDDLPSWFHDLTYDLNALLDFLEGEEE